MIVEINFCHLFEFWHCALELVGDNTNKARFLKNVSILAVVGVVTNNLFQLNPNRSMITGFLPATHLFINSCR